MYTVIKEKMKSVKMLNLIYKYRSSFSFIYRIIMGNSFKSRGGNVLKLQGTFVDHTNIDVKGVGNVIVLESDGLSKLSRCRILVRGNNNRIHIGNEVRLYHCVFHIEDDNNLIDIGDHSTVIGKTQFAAIEGTEILIGKDCMFSSNIIFRTGDSHSIVDAVTGERCNPSKSIYIGDHVWCGNSVIVLKGSNVSNDCVIATGSVVCGINSEPNSIIGGNPAKVIKKGVCWKRERI